MRGHIPYSAAEMAWLAENRMMVISDYHRAFVAAFGRSDVSAGHLHALRKRMGWKVGRDPGRYVGRGRKYSNAEIDWLRENCTMEVNAWCAAFRAAFGREDTTPAKLHSLRKRMGWKTGRTGHFETGAEPWSKGKKLPFNANSAAFHFEKGHRPHTWRGAGHESIGVEGYRWVIVDKINPHTGAPTHRVQKHRLLWEQANGPIPDGHVLKCLDGDKSNADPWNWELIPIGMLPRLNGKSGRNYDTAAAELKPTIMAVAKLEHAAKKRRSGMAEGRKLDGASSAVRRPAGAPAAREAR